MHARRLPLPPGRLIRWIRLIQRDAHTVEVITDSTRKKLWISNSFILGMVHFLRASIPMAFAAGKHSTAATVVGILLRTSLSRRRSSGYVTGICLQTHYRFGTVTAGGYAGNYMVSRGRDCLSKAKVTGINGNELVLLEFIINIIIVK